jgi:hypothetical protein
MKECIDSGDMITGDDVGADANLRGPKDEPQAVLEELRSSGGGTDPSSTAGIETDGPQGTGDGGANASIEEGLVLVPSRGVRSGSSEVKGLQQMGDDGWWKWVNAEHEAMLE